MITLYKVLAAAVFVAVMALSPAFVYAQRGGACPKSLAVKMTAATGYFVYGVLAILISATYDRGFDRWMLIALACSWIGDLFLHLWQSKVFYGIGFLGFLSAHFFFIAAFYHEAKKLDPGMKFLTVPEIVFIAFFAVFFVVFSVKTGSDIKGPLAVPIVIYSIIITTMLCKASVFGITAVKTGLAGGLPCVCSVLGGALFVASDFTISILMFNKKQKKNFPLKMFNIVSYFAAELLLASCMIFV